MLTDDEKLSLQNCDRIRNYPVRGLQVMPVPGQPMNVSICPYRGIWQVMHVNDALAFVKLALRKERQARTAKGRAITHAKRMVQKRERRQAAAAERKRDRAAEFDESVENVLIHGYAMLD